jgi:hypothetical protein
MISSCFIFYLNLMLLMYLFILCTHFSIFIHYVIFMLWHEKCCCVSTYIVCQEVGFAVILRLIEQWIQNKCIKRRCKLTTIPLNPSLISHFFFKKNSFVIVDNVLINISIFRMPSIFIYGYVPSPPGALIHMDSSRLVFIECPVNKLAVP